MAAEPRYTTSSRGKHVLETVDWYEYDSDHAPWAEEQVLILCENDPSTIADLQSWTDEPDPDLINGVTVAQLTIFFAHRYIHDNTQAVVNTLLDKGWLEKVPPTVSDSLAELHITK